MKWDVKSIERHLFGAGEALFQTGWFMESITTQVLVVFAIRTRRPIFRSRPHMFLAAMALGVIAVAIALPLLPVRRWLGFVAPPPLFFVFLIEQLWQLAARYDKVNRHIHRIESEEEPTADGVLEGLKKQRLKLKDDIATQLGKLERRM
ncbi:MAG TPA: DUF465 domain-containing protein [Candidatus Limnocylindrales bacterium]|nr:DUF465 domain-containing protein [Candidatus Limnocylindrales bacterium]